MIEQFLNMEGFFQLQMPDYRNINKNECIQMKKHDDEESRNLIIIAKTLCQVYQDMR